MKNEDLPVGSQMLANFGKHTRIKKRNTDDTVSQTLGSLVGCEGVDEHCG